MKNHSTRVHGEQYNSKGRDYVDSIQCSSCDIKFSSENLYIQHFQKKHGGFPPEYDDQEKFICDQCPKGWRMIHFQIVSTDFQNGFK